MRGLRSIEWEIERPARKGICCARSFGKLLTDKMIIAEAVTTYAANVAEKLRSEKSAARKLHVFIKTNPHRKEDKQYARSIILNLPVATNFTDEIIHYAIKALNIIYADGYNYMKAGVMAMDLVPSKNAQLNLMDNKNRGRTKKVMHVLDQLNSLHGRDTVRYAVQGYEKAWDKRAAMLSGRYTTDINQILQININS
jgi:DNA polymerase V